MYKRVGTVKSGKGNERGKEVENCLARFLFKCGMYNYAKLHSSLG